MIRSAVFTGAAIGVSTIILAGAAGIDCTELMDWRALTLILLYTSLLVVARYTPGICFYRLAVLEEPARYFRPELERAGQFADFTGTRLLFAGLIFTLADIALVLARTPDPSQAAPAMPTALRSALYALVLYVLASRSASTARSFARNR